MELQFVLHKSPQTVYKHLTNAELFVAIHPIIQRLEPLGGDKYKVYEKMKVGFMPYAFTYEATIVGNPDTLQVVINATVMKMTQIKMLFDISEVDGKTLVTERIQFKSWLPVKGILKKVFREQHTILFNNLEQAAS